VIVVKTPILGNLDLRAHGVTASDQTLPRVVPGRKLTGHEPIGLDRTVPCNQDPLGRRRDLCRAARN